ncbi:MAG: hypothetical protein SFW36_12055 [Leptolyngbyaceae cyanobacterium bins.59]|nr:hypothetical protein [Leptolyngbyaceae cyanobacterium bins.59]
MSEDETLAPKTAQETDKPSPWLIPPADRLGFIVGFTLLTLVGNVLFGFLFRMIAPILPPSIPLGQGGMGAALFGGVPHPLSSLVIGLLDGLILGLGQGILLSRYGPDLLRWASLTAIGSALLQVSFSLVCLGLRTPPALLPPLLAGTLTLLIGAMQWQILRHYVRRSSLWFALYPIAFFLKYPLISGILALIGLLKGLPVTTQMQTREIVTAYAGSLIFRGLIPAAGLCAFHRSFRASMDVDPVPVE